MDRTSPELAETPDRPGRPARPPGITAVAQLAGVSHQTVSRVINDFPGVRPQTRDRVLEAIAELGYRRNNAARTLVTRRSQLIGVVAVGSFLFGPTSTLAAIEQAARSHGYMTLLATLRAPDGDALRRAVDDCLDRSVDAIVVLASREPLVALTATLQLPVPLIVVGPHPGSVSGLHTVSVDQREGGHLAVRHLADLGHRRIVLLCGPADWRDAQERRQGALDEAAAQGVSTEQLAGDWTPGRGHEVGLALADGDLPDAVFAANDHMALGLLSAFASRGVRVPQDVSVVGFDDVPGSDYFGPGLTTVRQDFAALGRRVLAGALALLADEPPDLRAVPPSLTTRSSTTARG